MSDTETQTPETTALEVTASKVVTGDIVALSALLKEIGPEPTLAEVPDNLPLPAVITEQQSQALDRLTNVFGRVQPVERRALEPAELLSLMDERATLDEIEKLATARKESIRTAICNHFDVMIENSTDPEDRPDRDAKGHYVHEDKIIVTERAQKFSREVSAGGHSLSIADLKEQVEEGLLDRKDYLAMTREERVLDENKVMILLRKKPGLIGAIRRATRTGSARASLYVRKA